MFHIFETTKTIRHSSHRISGTKVSFFNNLAFDIDCSPFLSKLIQEKLVRMLGTIQSMLLLVWRVSSMYDNKATTVTLGQISLAKVCYSFCSLSSLCVAVEGVLIMCS
jgi:hypothetical protein